MCLETVKKFTFGAVRIWEENGYIHFSRFTAKQAETAVSRGFKFHPVATAGIRIEFSTCGGELSFDYKALKANDQDGFGLEITVDGIPVRHIYTEDIVDTGSVRYTFSESEHRVNVAVYLPNLASIQIKNLNLPEDAETVKKDVKLLALGDSITHGEWANHPNHTYINILADELNAEVVNQGIRGDVFFAGNIDADIPFNPDIVTVAYGVNDYCAGTLVSKASDEYFEKLFSLYGDKRIFVILPIWYGNEEKAVSGYTLDDGRRYLKSVAEKYPNMTVIDCSNAVPRLPEFYRDTILLHPNDMGYFYYARRVVKEVKKALGV